MQHYCSTNISILLFMLFFCSCNSMCKINNSKVADCRQSTCGEMITEDEIETFFEKYQRVLIEKPDKGHNFLNKRIQLCCIPDLFFSESESALFSIESREESYSNYPQTVSRISFMNGDDGLYEIFRESIIQSDIKHKLNQMRKKSVETTSWQYKGIDYRINISKEKPCNEHENIHYTLYRDLEEGTVCLIFVFAKRNSMIKLYQVDCYWFTIMD